MAGPLANFSLAFLFSMVLRFSNFFNLSKGVFEFVSFVVLINCV